MPETVTVDAPSDGQADSPSSVDERIKGFQRALSQKDTELQALRGTAGKVEALERQLEELRLAQMPETERQTYLSTKDQAELDQLRLKTAMLEAARKYPSVGNHLDSLFSFKTLDEQAQYLAALVNPQAKAATPAADDDSGDTDLNNPMRGPGDPISLPYGDVNDKATANSILAAFDKMTTAVARGDRRGR